MAVYNAKGQKLTCDTCTFGGREVQVRKLAIPHPEPLVICLGCFDRNRTALMLRVKERTYSVVFLKDLEPAA